MVQQATNCPRCLNGKLFPEEDLVAGIVYTCFSCGYDKFTQLPDYTEPKRRSGRSGFLNLD